MKQNFLILSIGRLYINGRIIIDLFPFSVLGLDIRNDKHFSELLCKEDKDASLEFMELYSDILYRISAKFNNRGTPEDSWEYRKKVDIP